MPVPAVWCCCTASVQRIFSAFELYLKQLLPGGLRKVSCFLVKKEKKTLNLKIINHSLPLSS